MFKKAILCTALAISVSACSTPAMLVKNPETGDVNRCGGGITTSLIDYYMTKNKDAECVEQFKDQGYEVIEQEKPVYEPKPVDNHGVKENF